MDRKIPREACQRGIKDLCAFEGGVIRFSSTILFSSSLLFSCMHTKDRRNYSTIVYLPLYACSNSGSKGKFDMVLEE